MIEFRYSQNRERQTWKYAYNGKNYTAIIICPVCANKIILTKHQIDNCGMVLPSLICSKCDFHKFIKLNDWLAKDDMSKL